MKRKIFIPIFVLFSLLTACKKNDVENLFDTIKSEKEKLIPSDTLVNENGFSKTDFKDRAEELIYIREYLKYKLPLIMIKKTPNLVKKAQYKLITDGENSSLEQAARRTISYSNFYEGSMYFIIEDNLSFKEVKYQLETFGEIKSRPVSEKHLTIEELNNLGRKDSIKTINNSIGDKIYGDFNGDGYFEYAFRVQTKKGYGNPVDGGVPDEYEVHFSDKNIKPITGNFSWFILINEGDLDNDSTDEISVREDPLNGCIGQVSTYTIKKTKTFKLINRFDFYSGACDNNISINPQDLIEKNNGVVYYYEYDINGNFSINKSGKKILAKKVKAFNFKTESRPIIINDSKVSNSTNDALANILKGSKSKYETDTGISEGSSAGSGYLFRNRKILYRPAPKYTCNESGKVVVEVSVDRSGNTVNAIAGINGTTNTAKCLLDEARIAAMNTKWEADENAPERQVGKIVYNFNLN